MILIETEDFRLKLTINQDDLSFAFMGTAGNAIGRADCWPDLYEAVDKCFAKHLQLLGFEEKNMNARVVLANAREIFGALTATAHWKN